MIEKYNKFDIQFASSKTIENERPPQSINPDKM